MAEELRYDYRRYLQAKRSVDDRSINRHVLDLLRAKIDGRRALRVLEIGGGTGSMVRRSLDLELLPAAHYTLVDRDAASLASLDAALLADAEAAFARFEPVHADIAAFLAEDDSRYDLVIANAVLDLLDVPSLLASLRPRCAPHALFWFTINFDGESCFLPEREGDDAIWQAYHESMNRSPGRRHAGRALLQTLVQEGAPLLATGSSDWIVHATDGAYAGDEAYFLDHIIHTIDSELCSAPPLASAAFTRWIADRHGDVAAARLIYIAHQIDVLSGPPRADEL